MPPWTGSSPSGGCGSSGYDGWWGNASLDWLLSLRGLRVFGEAALDFGGAFAGIAGAACPLSSSLEASLLYRYYSPRYIATHAGAYCRSNVNNEHGVSAALPLIFPGPGSGCGSLPPP